MLTLDEIKDSLVDIVNKYPIKICLPQYFSFNSIWA